MHWAIQYIGKPWISGARGPDAFDCYGLLYYVYPKHYGLEIPEFVGIDANDQLAVARAMRAEEREQLAQRWAQWRRVEQPQDGDAVAMGGAEALHHVGLYIALPEGGGILHCRMGCGVIFQTLAEAKLNGFARTIFYRHASRS